jgi:hypothetical protein
VETFSDDKACALEIERGNKALWEMLLGRVIEPMLSVALHWCTPTCARGTCPLLRHRGPLRERLSVDDCDAVLACYLYIAEKHLPVFVRQYPGDIGLTAWCVRCLRALSNDAHRRIDFARTGHMCAQESNLRIRVPRPRLPICLRDAATEQRQVYRLICQGKGAEEIAVEQRISEDEAQARIDALLSLLAERDWDAYIETLHRYRLKLHPMIGAFDRGEDDDSEPAEPPADGPTVEQRWALREAIAVFSRWMQQQSPADRLLLRLFLYEGKDAGEILARMDAYPDAPKSARQVYSRIETLINRMRAALPALLSHVGEIQTERRTFVDVLPSLMALMEENRRAYGAASV